MKLGVHVPNFASLASPADLADLAGRAEAAGWDGFFIWDHVARPEGTFPMAEPWVALTAVAMATQRLRIGPMVTPLARRRPWNVARQVASLDHLSGGRVTLGVGPEEVSSGPEFHDVRREESDPRVRGDMLGRGPSASCAAAWRGWYAGPARRHSLPGGRRDVFLPAHRCRPRSAHLGRDRATQRPAGAPGRRAGRGCSRSA